MGALGKLLGLLGGLKNGCLAPQQAQAWICFFLFFDKIVCFSQQWEHCSQNIVGFCC